MKVAAAQCYRAVTAVGWLVILVGNDGAASPAHTGLAAIIDLGKILIGLDN